MKVIELNEAVTKKMEQMIILQSVPVIPQVTLTARNDRESEGGRAGGIDLALLASKEQVSFMITEAVADLRDQVAQ